MSNGISTIEILVALTIMTLAVIASATVGIGAPNIIADARHAASGLEKAHTALIASLAAGGSLSSESLEDEGFSRLIARQEWTTSQGALRSIELSTLTGSSTEPETCDPFTSGDWTHPTVSQSYGLDDGLGLPAAAYSISSLSLSPGILSVGVGSTSEASRPSLLLFRLVGTSTPQLLAAFDNASTSRIGVNAVVSAGTYSFSGNAFNSLSGAACSDLAACSQINVYSPSGFATALALSTSTEPFAYRADGSNAPVASLFYRQGLLFAGLQKTVRGDEFNIIDAHDPLHLEWLSGFSIGRTVNGIMVRGNLAYVSTDDPARELMVFDIHDPAHPALYSVWDAPGSSTFGYGSASTAYGDTIRFGRTYSATDPEFELLRMREGSVAEIARVDSGTSKDPESVRALVTQDRLTFMLLTRRLDVLDTSDHLTSRLVGSYQLPAGSQATALACRNNQLYLSRIESDGTSRIDILQGS